MNLDQFLNELYKDGTLMEYANDPRAQFQIGARTYMGAQILPLVSTGERGNVFREEGFAMRSQIAADGTRFSPVPLAKAVRGQGMMIELGSNDTGGYLEGPEFDALNKYLNSNLAPQAIAQVSNFLQTQVVQPLTEIIEKQRWQAICDAQVIRAGANGYQEQVDYDNPAGHRVTVASGTTGAPAGWFDDTHDPLEDIYNLADTLNDKGYTPTRMFASNRVIRLLLRHPLVKASAGRVVSDLATSAVQPRSGRVTLTDLNGLLAEDGLPAIERYDLTYEGRDGSFNKFLRDTALVMVSTNSIDITYVDEQPLLETTSLGYVGLGRTAGKVTNERTVKLEVVGPDQDIKNPRVVAEGTQMTLPIIQNSKAVGVLNIPEPTP
jgi:hypothetical protein